MRCAVCSRRSRPGARARGRRRDRRGRHLRLRGARRRLLHAAHRHAARRCRDAGAHVIVTSGNHDSAARLGFQARCCATASTSSPIRSALATPVTIDDEHGPVHFYGIPFLEPASCVTCGRTSSCARSAQTLAHAMGLVRADLADARRSLGRDLALLRRGRRADAAPRARHPAGRHRRRAAGGLRGRRLRRARPHPRAPAAVRARPLRRCAAALQLRRGRQAARLVARRTGCRRASRPSSGSSCPCRAGS